MSAPRPPACRRCPHDVAVHRLPERGDRSVRGACSASDCPCPKYTPAEEES